MDVTDLGDEDRPDRPPNTVKSLDRLITRIVAQQLMETSFEHCDFAVVALDQITQ